MKTISLSFRTDKTSVLPPGFPKLVTNCYGDCIIKVCIITVSDKRYDILEGTYGTTDDIYNRIKDLAFEDIIIDDDRLIMNNNVIGIVRYELYELTSIKKLIN